MLIERFEISLDALELSNGRSPNGGMPLVRDVKLNVSNRSKDLAALGTLGDRTVGVVIGKLDDGTPAFAALKRQSDGSFWYGPLLPMDDDACANAESASLSV